MRNIFPGERAISATGGIIWMLVVSALMAIIVGTLTYQSCKPKKVPVLAATLEDTEQVVLTNKNTDGRVARLILQNVSNASREDLEAIAVYTGGDAAEHTARLDGGYWTANGTPLYGGQYGDSRAQGVELKWGDSDGSGNLTPGDWLDFYEGSRTGGMTEVEPGSDFRVKIIHKPTGKLLVNLVVKVY